MKKKIYITTIIILVISLVVTIIYFNKNKTPTILSGTSKNMILLEKNIETNKQEENDNEITNNLQENNNKTNNQTLEKNETQNKEYSEQEVIAYFKELNNEITNYNNDESVGKKIKEKFVKCIDFIFYEREIGGKTFKELSNSAKLKILEISMDIDSKIDNKFPGYKESISSSYQNIKSKIVEKYLETTTNICNNDEFLCVTAKEEFSNLKEKFGLTWDLIKEIASGGIKKIKTWYEIWKYK